MTSSKSLMCRIFLYLGERIEVSCPKNQPNTREFPAQSLECRYSFPVLRSLVAFGLSSFRTAADFTLFKMPA